VTEIVCVNLRLVQCAVRGEVSDELNSVNTGFKQSHFNLLILTWTQFAYIKSGVKLQSTYLTVCCTMNS